MLKQLARFKCKALESIMYSHEFVFRTAFITGGGTYVNGQYIHLQIV